MNCMYGPGSQTHKRYSGEITATKSRGAGLFVKRMGSDFCLWGGYAWGEVLIAVGVILHGCTVSYVLILRSGVYILYFLY